jgi:amphi-Trp domain-containing protein
MEEVLFEHEQVQSRTEIAALLRDVANKLDAGEPVTVSSGEQSISLDVPANPTFEVKVERETNGSEELSVEFELEWDADGGDGDASLSIE